MGRFGGATLTLLRCLAALHVHVHLLSFANGFGATTAFTVDALMGPSPDPKIFKFNAKILRKEEMEKKRRRGVERTRGKGAILIAADYPLLFPLLRPLANQDSFLSSTANRRKHPFSSRWPLQSDIQSESTREKSTDGNLGRNKRLRGSREWTLLT
ncbi:hypothetical protein SLE2022_391480 [Rubroshorea leprosula]